MKKHILESIQTKKNILNSENILKSIIAASSLIIEAYKNKNKVLIAGNGGSAADAQHIAAELVSKFYKNRPALNAIALTTNTSILTAIGNDYNNDYIFTRQIEAFGNEKDVFIAISTSGNSPNIINSIKQAKEQKLQIIGLTGQKKCAIDNLCDVIIKIPSEKTPIIQESHIMIGHIICGILESSLF